MNYDALCSRARSNSHSVNKPRLDTACRTAREGSREPRATNEYALGCAAMVPTAAQAA